jgi:hypothetical protein
MMFRYRVAALVLLAAAVPSGARAVAVREVHPRLVFHADSMAALRARIQTEPMRTYFLEYKDRVDSRDVDTDLLYAADWAAMYLLTGETNYADIAIDALMANIGEACCGQGDGWGRIPRGMLVYDWCYDRMTSAERQAVHDDIINSDELEWEQPGGTGVPWQWHDFHWYYVYPIIGDIDYRSSDDRSRVQASFERTLALLDDQFLPCYDEVYPNGAQDGYTFERLVNFIVFLDALRNGTDYDGYALRSRYVQNMANYYMARIRPRDQRALDLGRHAVVWERLPAKYNTSESDPLAWFAYMGSRQGNAYAQAIADDIAQDASFWASNSWARMAWYIPNLGNPPPLSSLPKDYYDQGVGFFMTRSNWDLSGSSDAIFADFFCGLRTQSQSQILHWQLGRGDDVLFVDSGKKFRSDLELGFIGYFQNGIAHNVPVIYDSDFDGGTFNDGWGTQHPRPNWGNALNRCIPDSARVRFPACDDASGPLNGWDDDDFGWQGEIKKIEYNDDYVSIVADASSAFNPETARKVERHWMLLRPDVVLVTDEIELAKAGPSVRSLLHFIDKPAGPPTDVWDTIRGDKSTGGVFDLPIDEELVIEHGDSQARVHVVRATGDGEARAYIRLIGGQNGDGEPMKQNLQPGDPLTYVSSAADISYECYDEVIGQNYVAGGEDDYITGQDDIDERNDSPLNPRDNLGDYRAEIRVDDAASKAVITYVVWVGDVTDPAPEITSSTSGEIVTVKIASGGTTRVLTAGLPGSVYDSITYTVEE